MATSNAVWGIDIGQCALKALRCSLSDDGETIVADAFDYIEYPKILTQPDANPEELVKDALQQFLSNNSVRDSRVAISVAGQSGLTRFIKLPPVEAKKIPDIVKYEAKQQIPFSLDDVIWDYQPLLGGMQDEGVALETEVGLFAMKREQVFRSLRPFRDAGIELDIVQLTPISIYNAVTYGVMKGLPNNSEFDPDNPPPSVVVISMGTDTTDLVVTNGFRIWQRSVPIGGSHFTKQLTKEMKLTFAKAEHLKRNARQSEDPKAVFQAMRPVFNDFVQELQRSIGYFRSIDRTAKIEQGVVLGNAMRLPGLQPYVEKNLGIPIRKVSEYRHLDGASVISTPKFKDNLLSFANAYGLCVQGAGKGRLSTNLIPRELVTSRLIRRKKPWALIGIAVFMLAVTFNFLFHWSRWREAHADNFSAVAQKVQMVASNSGTYKSQDETLQQEFDSLKKVGDEVVGGADARFLVLELLKAFNSSLPRDETVDPMAVRKGGFDKRPELFIEYADSQYFTDLTNYFTPDAKDRYVGFLRDLEYSKKRAAAPPPEQPVEDGEASDEEFEEEEDFEAEEADDEESGMVEEPDLPSFATPGWVFQIRGFHFHNDDIYNRGAQYLVNTILNELENGSVDLPSGPGGEMTTFTMKELGIYCPLIAVEGRDVTVNVPNPDYEPPVGQAAANRPGGEARRFNFGNQPTDPKKAEFTPVTAHEFTIQFMWIETRASQRLEARQKAETTDETADDVAGDF
ncbi:MAG: type IV pilus assembly protein PilM [Planctomycetaceae bacterium]|nr:type IV pilus assembly protein PilM [Planctomycetaceae bacterium]